MAEIKRLYRSRTDRTIAGVCGGVAEYFGIDANLVRLLWVGTVPLWGYGALMYLAAAFLVPGAPQPDGAAASTDGDHKAAQA